MMNRFRALPWPKFDGSTPFFLLPFGKRQLEVNLDRLSQVTVKVELVPKGDELKMDRYLQGEVKLQVETRELEKTDLVVLKFFTDEERDEKWDELCRLKRMIIGGYRTRQKWFFSSSQKKQ